MDRRIENKSSGAALWIAGACAVAYVVWKAWARPRAVTAPAPSPAAPPAPPAPPARPASAPAPVGPPPPLPDGWERWHGARPEIRGWPENTILAVAGLERWSDADRAAVLGAAEELGVAVDSLVSVWKSESGLKPWNAYGVRKDKDDRPLRDPNGQIMLSAENVQRVNNGKKPFFAVGLLQLTIQANLEGFTTPEALLPVLDWTPERQIREIAIPLYRKMKVQGAHPGKLYMLNFLPQHAGQGPDFVLGTRDADGMSGKIYTMNRGFDANQDGNVTVAEVWSAAARAAKSAAGRRMTVDGRVLDVPAA